MRLLYPLCAALLLSSLLFFLSRNASPSVQAVSLEHGGIALSTGPSHPAEARLLPPLGKPLSLTNSPSPLAAHLIWSAARPLTWPDFQGIPEPESGVDALSSCGLICDPALHRDGSLRFTVEAYFSHPDSWVDGPDASALLLQHEQGHFNIGEIYARKLRRKLSNTRFTREGLDRQIQAVYQEVFDEYAKAQQTYDEVTAHSTNPAAQAEWDRWMNKELSRFEAYRGRTVRASLSR